tara:strand:- start:35 stop:574 length:540 start_codon:yes stop_codon:yes gene_type:complete
MRSNMGRPGGADIDALGALDNHFGIADYNDTSTTSSPVALVADTWTTLPNDGLGTFSQESLPSGVSTLLVPASGAIDISQLSEKSTIKIRFDFGVTPSSNNSALGFRLLLGDGVSAYSLPTSFGRLDEGAGVIYDRGLFVGGVYAGDLNTIDNPIFLQAKCSANATLINRGMYIEVYKR